MIKEKVHVANYYTLHMEAKDYFEIYFSFFFLLLHRKCYRKNGWNYFYSLSINFLSPQTMITYTNIGKSLQHMKILIRRKVVSHINELYLLKEL